jgi:hypothetical protein
MSCDMVGGGENDDVETIHVFFSWLLFAFCFLLFHFRLDDDDNSISPLHCTSEATTPFAEETGTTRDETGF